MTTDDDDGPPISAKTRKKSKQTADCSAFTHDAGAIARLLGRRETGRRADRSMGRRICRYKAIGSHSHKAWLMKNAPSPPTTMLATYKRVLTLRMLAVSNTIAICKALPA